MQIAVSVCFGNFLIINFRKPIVCSNGTRVAENKSANRIGNGGVFLNTPVGDINVTVNNILVIKEGALNISDFLTLFTIKNVCLCYVVIARFDKYGFYAVLNFFNSNLAVLNLRLVICGNFERQKVNNISIILALTCVKRFFNRLCDFGNVKLYGRAVTFDNFVHDSSP